MNAPTDPKVERAKPGVDLRVLTMVVILLAMWVLFRFKVGDFYFSGESFAKLSRDMACWTILAAGMTLVIVSGSIDLSVGSLLALVVGVTAYLIDPEDGLGWDPTLAVAIGLGLGLGLGLAQGFIIAYFRVPAFIVTLGGLFIFRGFTQKVSARDPRLPEDCWVNTIGFDYAPPTMAWAIGAGACLALAAALLLGHRRKRRLGVEAESAVMLALKIAGSSALILGFVYKVNQYRGLPAQTLIMAAAMVAAHLVARHTVFGRRVFAIGGAPQAARLAGIDLELNVILVFGLMGLLAGVAGIVWMAQNQGATQNAGEWYELYAIAACVIGGASLMGGVGSVPRSFLGALVMATVIQGMDYTGLSNWLQLVVRGGVLVVAVAIDVGAKNPPDWLWRLRRAWRRKSSE